MKNRIVVLDDYFVTPRFLWQVFQYIEKHPELGTMPEVFLLTDNTFTANACQTIGYHSILSKNIPKDLEQLQPDLIIAGNNGGVKQSFPKIREMQIPTLMLPHGFKWNEEKNFLYTKSEWRSELMEYTSMCCSSESIKNQLISNFAIEKEKLVVCGSLEIDRILANEPFNRSLTLSQLGIHDHHKKIITLYTSHEADSYPIFHTIQKTAEALDQFCLLHPNQYQLIVQLHPYEFELGTRRPSFQTPVIYTGMPGAVNYPGTIPIEPEDLARINDFAIMAFSTGNLINIAAGANLFILSSGNFGYEKDLHYLFGQCAHIIEIKPDYTPSPTFIKNLLQSKKLNSNLNSIKRNLSWYDNFCDGKTRERISTEIFRLVHLKQQHTTFFTMTPLQLLEKRCQHNPQNLWALSNLGVALGYAKEYQKAEKTWKKILTQEPKFLPAIYNLAHLFLDNNLDEAEQYVEQALSCDAYHISAPLAYLKQLLSLGLFKHARPWYERVKNRFEMYSHLSYIHLDLLEVRLLLEEPQHIPTIISEFFKYYLPSGENLEIILRCLARRKLWKEALPLVQFQPGNDRNKNEPWVRCLYRFSSQLEEQHHYPEAALGFRRVIELATPEKNTNPPGFPAYLPGAYYHLARVCLALQDNNSALDYIQHCLQLEPGHQAAKQLLEQSLKT